MSEAGTLVQRRVWTNPTVLRRVRRLPCAGQVGAREQRPVRIDDIVARAEQPSAPVAIAVAAALRVIGRNLSPFMIRHVGDAVEAGEVIAKVKGPMGIGGRTCKAPISGRLVAGPASSGEYVIVPDPKPVELKAHYPGIVTAVIPQQGIVIQTTALGAQAAAGCGGEGGGPIRVVAAADEPISANRLASDHGSTVVVGGSADLAALKRAVTVGAAGVIVGCLRASVFADYLAEEVKIPLLVIDGFGDGGMSPFIHEMFRQNQSREARISTGSTTLGYGTDGQPPEVLIPTDGSGARREQPLALIPGGRVRVVAGPRAFATGVVTSVGQTPALLSPGVVSDWVRVDIGTEQPVRAALANIELLNDPTE